VRASTGAKQPEPVAVPATVHRRMGPAMPECPAFERLKVAGASGKWSEYRAEAG